MAYLAFFIFAMTLPLAAGISAVGLLKVDAIPGKLPQLLFHLPLISAALFRKTPYFGFLAALQMAPLLVLPLAGAFHRPLSFASGAPLAAAIGLPLTRPRRRRLSRALRRQPHRESFRSCRPRRSCRLRSAPRFNNRHHRARATWRARRCSFSRPARRIPDYYVVAHFQYVLSWLFAILFTFGVSPARRGALAGGRHERCSSGSRRSTATAANSVGLELLPLLPIAGPFGMARNPSLSKELFNDAILFLGVGVVGVLLFLAIAAALPPR